MSKAECAKAMNTMAETASKLESWQSHRRPSAVIAEVIAMLKGDLICKKHGAQPVSEGSSCPACVVEEWGWT